jgi:hypothetical protein
VIGKNGTRWAEDWFGDSTRSDGNCKNCHAGPTHHAVQEPESPACASCHHEHQGRDASLVRIGDEHCTKCHNDLKDGHLKGGREPTCAREVTRFDASGHPPFGAKTLSDPGSLKFSHALHLTEGMAAEDGGPVQTLALIDQEDQVRYKVFAKDPGGVIQLNCAVCHVLDGEDFGLPAFDLRLMSSLNNAGGIPAVGKNLIIVADVNNALHFRIIDGHGKVVVDTNEKRLTEKDRQIEAIKKQLNGLWPPYELTTSDQDRLITAATSIVNHARLPVRPGPTRADGRAMLPITYENQCRSCHPLQFDPSVPSLEMKHGLQPSQVHESLWEIYAAQYQREDPALFGERLPQRPLPGRSDVPASKSARELIERKVRIAERILFGPKKCGECHSYVTIPDHSPVAALDHWDPARNVAVKATNVPGIWFRSAVFDHTAHRALDCKACHDGAYPTSGQPSRSSQDVLIPSQEICLKCHSPSRPASASMSPQGGAGFDCTECHRYHNGDALLQGRGATARGVKERMSLPRFLLGVPEGDSPR